MKLNKALHLTAKSTTSLRSILLLAASELCRYVFFAGNK